MGKKNELIKIRDAIKEIKDNQQKIKKDILSIVQDQVEKDLKTICDSYIKEFYDSYKPNRYSRKHTLYNVYKIYKTHSGIGYSFSADNMGDEVHRASNEYIYNLAFERGYHGGADHINDVENSIFHQEHPQPGVPYWRIPNPGSEQRPYNNWYKPAKKSIAPKTKIDIAISQYEANKKIQMLDHTLEEVVDLSVDTVFGQYKLFSLR